MKDILEKCEVQYNMLHCCHKGKSLCCCYDCLKNGFYGNSEDYLCPKKHFYYVMNYGPSFANEIYYYLKCSKILEKNYMFSDVNVLSLGCGFAPDLHALSKYVNDFNLPIKIKYTGIDESKEWNKIRHKFSNSSFLNKDVLKGFDLSKFDLVFIVKLFSTLYKQDKEVDFLKILKNEITKNLKEDGYIIFIDINNRAMGRDNFDANVKALFSSNKKYYYDISNSYTYCYGYKAIPFKGNVFEIPVNLVVSPKMDVNKTIIFEYKK